MKRAWTGSALSGLWGSGRIAWWNEKSIGLGIRRLRFYCSPTELIRKIHVPSLGFSFPTYEMKELLGEQHTVTQESANHDPQAKSSPYTCFSMAQEKWFEKNFQRIIFHDVKIIWTSIISVHQQSVIVTKPCSFIYILPMAAFTHMTEIVRADILYLALCRTCLLTSCLNGHQNAFQQ